MTLIATTAMAASQSFKNDAGGETVETSLQALRDARNITVTLIVPRATFYRFGLDHERLKDVGCRYSSTDKRSADGLIQVLSTSSVTAAPDPGRKLDLRYAIEADTSDGRLLSIVFEDNLGGDHGVQGRIGDVSILASPSLPASLRSWVFGSGLQRPEGRCSRDE